MSDDLPEGWRWARFSEVAHIASNLVDPKGTPNAIHIAPNHIESWSGRLLDRGTVAGDAVTSSKHAFRAGQILYSKIRPYLAKATLVDFDGVCSADMYPIDAREDVVDPAFLLAWMLTPDFTEAASGRQGRTVLPKINQAALSELMVPVPPIEQQRAVAERLQGLRARSRRAQDALDAVPALLERLRQSILAAAFRGDLTADWREQNPDVEPASELLKRMRLERRKGSERAELAKILVRGKRASNDGRKAKYAEPEAAGDSELPELPSGWCWTTVRDVCAVFDPNPSHRYPSYENGVVPLLSTREFSGSDEWALATAPLVAEEAWAEQYARCRFAPEDIVIARKGRLGLARRAPKIARYAFSHTVFVVRADANVASDWLLWFLRQDSVVSWLEMEMNNNTGVPTLGKAVFERVPIPFPPLAEQEEIARSVASRVGACDSAASSLPSLRDRVAALDIATLAAAFRGEIPTGE